MSILCIQAAGETMKTLTETVLAISKHYNLFVISASLFESAIRETLLLLSGSFKSK